MANLALIIRTQASVQAKMVRIYIECCCGQSTTAHGVHPSSCTKMCRSASSRFLRISLRIYIGLFRLIVTPEMLAFTSADGHGGISPRLLSVASARETACFCLWGASEYLCTKFRASEVHDPCSQCTLYFVAGACPGSLFCLLVHVCLLVHMT